MRKPPCLTFTLKLSVGSLQRDSDKGEGFTGVGGWTMSMDRSHQTLLHVHGSSVHRTDERPIRFGERK